MAKFGLSNFNFSNGKRFITQSNREDREPREPRRRKEHSDYVTINVSGVVFKTKQETLGRFPDTLLGSHSERMKYYDERSGEFFLDRHSPSFAAILYYYQSNGQIHKPSTVPMNLFKEELTFFKIKYGEYLEEQYKNRWTNAAMQAAAAAISDNTGPNAVDPINNNPAHRYILTRRGSYQYPPSGGRPSLSRNGSGPLVKPGTQMRRETIGTTDHTQIHIREPATETPRLTKQTSPTAPKKSRASVPALPAPFPEKKEDLDNVDYTHPPPPKRPSYKYRRSRLKIRLYDMMENPETGLGAKIFSWISMTLIVLSVGTFIAETLPAYRIDLTSKHWYQTTTGIFFFTFETVCISFFTVELLGRFLTCPDKKAFMKIKLNWIDLISILPYYLELIIPKTEDEDGNLDSIGSLVMLRVLRLFRVLRIFKLSRHSKNMLAFGIALRASMAELMSLGLFLLIDIVVFASSLYYAEMDIKGTQFDSIPASAWWAVVTVTTLGYGDMCPETPVGKLLGTLCVFSGILVIAFQMPIMVAKFTWTFMQNTGSESPSPDLDDEDYDEYDEEPLLGIPEEGFNPSTGDPLVGTPHLSPKQNERVSNGDVRTFEPV